MQGSDVNNVPAKLEGYIKMIIEKEGYIKYNVDIKHLTQAGHLMGILYVIYVNGQTIDGDKEIHFFVKQIIANKDKMTILNSDDVYYREYFTYTELFKIFKELQDEVHIPVKNSFETAINYDALTSQTIILENLTKRGFSTYRGMDVAPLKYAELCMQQLAKFHSFTFVLQARRPEVFDKIKEMRQSIYFGEDWNSMVKNMYHITITSLDDDVRSKVAQKISDIVDKYPLYMNDTSTVRTLCHGDYRKSNIMVKEINCEPSEVIPVDYQLIHYGSPILDIIYFIFLSTDHKFRESHMENLKNLYYHNLKTFLDYFQIDVESVYRKEDYERDFTNKLDFGLMNAVCVLPFIFTAEDDVHDITDYLSKESYKVDKRFRDRIRGTVDEFIKWGYL